MNKKITIGLVITSIILAGIIGGGLGLFFSDSLMDPFFVGKTERENLKEKIEKENETRSLTLAITSSITLINITLSIILISLYVNLYRRVKSEFTVGLIIIMIAFLIYAITSNPFFHLIFGYRGIFGIGPFILIPHIFTTLALAVLLYISLK
jgi:hypothetical protein